MSAAIKDNKKTEANNDEVAKKLLDIKTQSMETCPHRKTPVSQDIGTLFYDCEYAYDLEIILKMFEPIKIFWKRGEMAPRFFRYTNTT